MPRGSANYEPEQKDRALKLIAEGALSVAEISRETGITPKNISRWKTEINGGASPNGRKRRRRVSSEPQAPIDWELSYNLEKLENEYLRGGLPLPTNEERYKLEILYLRERAKKFGDDPAPLFYFAQEDAKAQECSCTPAT